MRWKKWMEKIILEIFWQSLQFSFLPISVHTCRYQRRIKRNLMARNIGFNSIKLFVHSHTKLCAEQNNFWKNLTRGNLNVSKRPLFQSTFSVFWQVKNSATLFLLLERNSVAKGYKNVCVASEVKTLFEVIHLTAGNIREFFLNAKKWIKNVLKFGIFVSKWPCFFSSKLVGFPPLLCCFWVNQTELRERGKVVSLWAETKQKIG